MNVNDIIISNRVKNNNDTHKYFIGYLKDDVSRPLCVILTQMSWYIKYFQNGGKNVI